MKMAHSHCNKGHPKGDVQADSGRTAMNNLHGLHLPLLNYKKDKKQAIKTTILWCKNFTFTQRDIQK